MKRRDVLKAVLLIAIVVLLGNTVSTYRDYQDSWILEGLEISFLFFVITYSVAFFSEKRTPWLVALAVIGRIVLLLIPNLKYIWFQGIAIDQHLQHALANQVYSKGYISDLGSAAYIKTPLIHLLFSIFSIVSQVPVVDSIKLLPVLLSPTFPLLIYFVFKRIRFPSVHRSTALKYALFISSLPITPEKYTVTGSQFGVLLAFLMVSSLVVLLKDQDRRYLGIVTFFSFALAAAHSVTSVLLPIFLSAAVLLHRVTHFRFKSHLKAPVVLTIASISLAWLMFHAELTLTIFTRIFFVDVPAGGTPAGSEHAIPRFFELARVDVVGAISTGLVYKGAEMLFWLLALAGLIVLVRQWKRINDPLKFLTVFCFLLILFVPVGLYVKAAGFRTLHLVSPLFAIFCSVFLLHMNRRKSWTVTPVFLLMMLTVTLQLYACQPLVAPASSLSKELPSDQPVSYVNKVNSIYQRQMIDFGREHVTGLIACDFVTGNQIEGLTGFDFSTEHLLNYYPLDKNQTERRYDNFFVHFPGKSGILAEKAEVRTRSLILHALNDSSIVYTNGESFILSP